MIKIEYDEQKKQIVRFCVVDENDRKNGTFKTYHRGSGTLWEKGTYRNGKLEGSYEVYYSDGRLARRCFYRNGLRDGLYERYFSNGLLEVKCRYEQGKHEGIYETYYINGRLHEIITFRNGKADGIHEIYDKKGNLQREDIMYHGKCIKTNRSKVKKERKALGKELGKANKKLPLGQLRQQTKRKLIARFRAKYPKSPILTKLSEQLYRQ